MIKGKIRYQIKLMALPGDTQNIGEYLYKPASKAGKGN